MIALFILLMAFVFSTALLTPIIGKRNLIFVICLGFVVGMVGGIFFISPVFDDIPVLASSFYHQTSDDLETLDVNVSTNVDVNRFSEELKNMEGVKNVQVAGITLKTTQFSPRWKKILEKRVITSNKDIKSAKISSNDTIFIETEKQDTQEVIKKLDKWLMYVGAIDIKYSTIHFTVKVESSKKTAVIDKISKEAVVTDINGPTTNKINYLKSVLPDSSNIIILCGFIGVLVGLIGLFIDSILEVVGNIKEKMAQKKN